MALTATIYKATLQIADMDRDYYQDHAVTMARHPTETDERLMVRLLAFALHADEGLSFGRGIGVEDEPALWKKDLTGRIEEWIEVGLPDERLLRQACGRAAEVWVYAYGGRSATQWWDKQQGTLARLANLTVVNLPWEGTRALGDLARQNMTVQCTVQEGQVWLADGAANLRLDLSFFKTAAGARRG